MKDWGETIIKTNTNITVLGDHLEMYDYGIFTALNMKM